MESRVIRQIIGVGRDDKHGIHTNVLGKAGELDRLTSRPGAGFCNHQSAPIGGTGDVLGHGSDLLWVQVQVFADAHAQEQHCQAVFDQELHVVAHTGMVDLVVRCEEDRQAGDRPADAGFRFDWSKHL